MMIHYVIFHVTGICSESIFGFCGCESRVSINNNKTYYKFSICIYLVPNICGISILLLPNTNHLQQVEDDAIFSGTKITNESNFE